MAYAIDTYTGNASTTSFSITFPYITQANVIVTVDGVTKTLSTHYTFSNSSTIAFGTAPASSAIIKITRSTNRSARLVDYQDGSTITEAILDQDGNQSFFMAQEAIDITEGTLNISASTDQWDATSKRITNVANPTSAQDVATKDYLENTFLTTANKTALTNVNTNIANINAVNSNATNINLVAGDATDIGIVATNIADVSKVADDITKVIAVANDLAEAVSEVETVADDLNEATSEIETVAGAIANVDIVGGAIANVNTLAGLNTEITNLNNIRTDISGVNAISADVTAVKNNSVNITAVKNNSVNINAVNTNSANINAVKLNETNINAVNSNSANINTVAGLDTEITALGQSSVVTSIGTVATNLASVNNFAEQYRISSSAPTSSLTVGDLYFDTTANELKVYKTSGWAAAGSTVNGTSARFTYTISGTPTSVSGADANGNTLAYDAGFCDVFLNGVRLSGADITITSGTSIVFASALANGDLIDIVAYGTFNVASLSASNIDSGTVNSARLPTVPTTKGGTGLTSLGTAGQVLKVNSGANALEYGQASSAEVYGFNKNSSGQLIITTTNQGVDNITSSTFATFDDVLFSASGFVFSISNGDLISTI